MVKISIEVDCTPQEARAFLGLPDVADMQKRLLLESEERLRAVIADMDSQKLAELWLPQASKSFEQLMQIWSLYGTKNHPGEPKA